MKVRETIHHGDYHNVREDEIEPTFEGFVGFFLDSPYRGAATAETLAGNTFFRKAFRLLMCDGRSSHGWARYEVVSDKEV